MGQIHSLVSRTISAVQSTGELSDPVLSVHDIFQAIERSDSDTLSRMLDENQFDLTAFDETNGETILHRAISLGRDDITEMLLRRAEEDPRVLNAQDRQGDTPLMRAAAMGNVAVMKALVDAGGRVDDSLTLVDVLPGDRESGKIAVALPALMLIKAQGDISTAFRFAVCFYKTGASKLFFDAGASTVSLLKNLSHIEWMFARRFIRADDVFAAVDKARKSRNKETLEALTHPSKVLLTLDALADRDDKTIVAALKRFIDAGARGEDLLSAAVSRWVTQTRGEDPLRGDRDGHPAKGPDDLGVIRLLISIGAPIAPELTKRHADPRSADIVQKLIRLRADITGTPEVPTTVNARRVDLIAHSALENLLRSSDLSEAEKISKLKALILDVGHDAADELARGMVREGRPLTDVRLLVLAGAPPTDRLLMALAVRAHKAEHKPTSSAKPVQSPERELIRQVMHLGADGRSTVEQLLDANQTQAKKKLNREAAVSLNAARIIMDYALPNLLGKESLSNAEKVAELKKLMTLGTRAGVGELASDLLLDAVNAGHWSTVKLMAIAEVPATKALVSLSKGLVEMNEVAEVNTIKLIHHGVDFRPAMEQLRNSVKAHTENGEHDAAKREQDALNALGVRIAFELAPRGPGNANGQILPDQ